MYRIGYGWDSEMMCYPCVIENGDELVMFYNGNEHGKYALGYAACRKADLKDLDDLKYLHGLNGFNERILK